MNVLVTGYKGFVGRNLCSVLRTIERIRILEFDCDNTPAELETMLSEAEVIFHLAGVNRPKHEEEFKSGNAGLLKKFVLSFSDWNAHQRLYLPHPFRLNLTTPTVAASFRLSRRFRLLQILLAHVQWFIASRTFLVNGVAPTTTR